MRSLMLWWTARQLRSSQPATRLQAIRSIERNASSDAVALLAPLLLDPHEDVSRLAAEVLERILTARQDDTDCRVQLAVVTILGAILDPPEERQQSTAQWAVSLLLAMIAAGNPILRSRAVDALSGALRHFSVQTVALAACWALPSGRLPELIEAALRPPRSVPDPVKSLLLRAAARRITFQTRPGCNPDQQRLLTLVAELGGPQAMRELGDAARQSSYGRYLAPQILRAFVKVGEPATLEAILDLAQSIARGPLDFATGEDVLRGTIASLEAIRNRPQAVADAIVALEKRQLALSKESSERNSRYSDGERRPTVVLNPCPRCGKEMQYHSTPRSMGGGGSRYKCSCGHVEVIG